MIVNHARQFVYVGPPKTASTTLHHWFSQPAFGGDRWHASRGDQHETEVPPEARWYFVVASIRHPMPRAVSLWRHSQIDRASPAPELRALADFLHWVPDAEEPLYWMSQSAWLRGVRLDATVRAGHLAEDLGRLPFLPGLDGLEPLERLNPTAHPPWRDLCGRRERRLIAEIYGDDFEAFPAVGW